VVEELLVMKLTERRHRAYQTRLDDSQILKEKVKQKETENTTDKNSKAQQVADDQMRTPKNRRKGLWKKSDDDALLPTSTSTYKKTLEDTYGSRSGTGTEDSGSSSPCPSSPPANALPIFKIAGAEEAEDEPYEADFYGTYKQQQQQNQQLGFLNAPLFKSLIYQGVPSGTGTGGGTEAEGGAEVEGGSGSQALGHGTGSENLTGTQMDFTVNIGRRAVVRPDSIASPPAPPLAATPESSKWSDGDRDPAFVPLRTPSPGSPQPLLSFPDGDYHVKLTPQQQQQQERLQADRVDITGNAAGSEDDNERPDLQLHDFEESHAIHLEALLGRISICKYTVYQSREHRREGGREETGETLSYRTLNRSALNCPLFRYPSPILLFFNSCFRLT
jgi:hypothetical protein